DVDGFSNWLIVMMSINVIALICENLTRFGLIATPLDIVHTVICLILEHWWLLFATAGYFILQMLHTFLIEKLLSMGLVSERIGMTLHAINVFFLHSAVIVTARTNGSNP
ncbi:hypothetical protein ILUMI_17040, partial [Ignelater luminosus]